MLNIKQKSAFQRFQRQINQYDWVLLTVVILISLGGLAFVASAIIGSFQSGTRTGGTFISEFGKQIIQGFGIGGLLAFLLARYDYHKLFKYKNIIILITLGSLVYIILPVLINAITGKGVDNATLLFDKLPIKPRSLEGAIRWIRFGFGDSGIIFQVAEIAKLTILIYVASFINQLQNIELTWDNFKKPIYVYLISAVAIVIQPDLGSVVVISVVIFCALFITKLSGKHVAIFLLFVTVFSSFFIAIQPYRLQRFQAWYRLVSLDSNSSVSDLSTEDKSRLDQIREVQTSLALGGVWGVGYGNGKEKGLVPQVSSDAIIAVIGEEMGLVFSIVFLSLYFVILYRAIKISKEAPDDGGKALAVGIGVWIFFQALWNIAGIIGLVPLKGLPLPLVSEGGSAVAVNLMAIGVLLNVSSQKEQYVPAKKSVMRRV